MRREPENPEERVPVVECLDGPARITSKERAPIHSVKNGILQNACSTSPKMDARVVKCSYAHRQVEEQPSKRSKKNGDKSTVAMLRLHDNWVTYFQDMEPPRSSILRRKPIRCVRFTKAVVRHADIRHPNHRLE